ncbi:hypothetical protein LELG_00200 [Lodderomyces elongisporus NRRL YB-4239]|uniref:Uncharacterized protein n=1 Tax=Lodderomyces elongisporus (strain ATCC 11503 / CBS 2605 / JCM 1781 / NBRC 1676 / NRRL YB-4239) TaxID=379508 RepID=A5DS64_LODEL|nr:hypothetical protein LELG_00200 [Lodderomyces elongisporus NRRL YB-4239]
MIRFFSKVRRLRHSLHQHRPFYRPGFPLHQKTLAYTTVKPSPSSKTTTKYFNDNIPSEEQIEVDPETLVERLIETLVETLDETSPENSFEEPTFHKPYLWCKEFYQKQNRFKNPYIKFNQSLVRNRDYIDLYQKNSTRDFQQIVNDGKRNSPQVGSIVEFVQNNDCEVGVVIRNLGARFDERLNHLLVLTSSNRIVKVKPLEIKFHLHKVMHPMAAEKCQQILLNRHDTNHYYRNKVVNFVNNYIYDVLRMKRNIRPQVNRMYTQFTGDRMVPITIVDAIDSLKFVESDLLRIAQSYYHQCVLVHCIHWTFMESCMWIVPNYVGPAVTNLTMWKYSNDYISTTQYFVNSEQNWLSIYNFQQSMSADENRCIQDLNNFIANVKSMGKDELEMYLCVFEGRHYVDFLNVLKFAVVYPHDSIITHLNKLDVFKSGCSVARIYQELIDMKIYDLKNEKSDMFLGAGLVAGNALNASTLQIRNQTKHFMQELYDSIFKNKKKDYAKHLRFGRKYYTDHTVYGFLANEEDPGSLIAVSLETINSRNSLINIHIPDFVTKISPSSQAFKDLILGRYSQLDLNTENKRTAIRLNPILEKLLFKNYAVFDQDEDLWDDLFDSKRMRRTRENISDVTCLTITFRFNSMESNPFDDLHDKISVSFDSLTGVNLKNMSKSVLNDCLTGRLEPSFFSLLHRKHNQQQRQVPTQELNSTTTTTETTTSTTETSASSSSVSTSASSQNKQSTPNLNKADIHNLNYIHGVLKTFFKVRGHAGANTMESEDDSDSISSNANENSGSTLSSNRGYNGGHSFLGQSVYLRERSAPTTSRPVSASTGTADFMVRETKLFADLLAAEFCSFNGIPIAKHLQEIDPIEYESDKVTVHHDNVMIPPLESLNYYHSIMAKNTNGYISQNAHIISNNYLQPQKTTVLCDETFQPLGFSGGFSEVANVANFSETMLNHLQIFSFIQARFMAMNSEKKYDASNDRTKNSFFTQYDYLEHEGFSLFGPFDEASILPTVFNLEKFQLYETFWKYCIKRFHTLLWVQLNFQLYQDKTFDVKLECIVTYVAKQEHVVLLKCFCSDWGIEVDVLDGVGNDVQIGSRIVCDEILHLDPISGSCLLKSTSSPEHNEFI